MSLEKEKKHRDKGTHGEHQVAREAETGVIYLQTQKHPGLWATSEAKRKDMEQILLHRLQREDGPATLWFWTFSLQN